MKNHIPISHVCIIAFISWEFEIINFSFEKTDNLDICLSYYLFTLFF